MNIKKIFLITIILLISLNKLYASVEPTSGRYVDVFEDLSIQIIGGPLIWERVYRDRQWYFNHSWSSLTFEHDVSSGEVKRIIRGKDSYSKLDSAGTLFKFGPRMRIRKNTDGTWTWQDRDGNSTEYAANGKALSTHKQSGSFITLMYNGDDKISGAKDVHGNQVLWIDYDLVTGQLDTVKDYGNREVKYTWEAIGSGSKYKLTKVTDARGYDWLYDYATTPARDGYVSLIQKTDPELRETHISYGGSGRVKNTTNALGQITSYHFDYIKSRKEYYLKTSFPGGRETESWFKRDGELTRHDINGLNVRSITDDIGVLIEKDTYGKITRREYDEFKNIRKITYPDGSFETFTYDLLNSNLLSYQNKNGVLSNYEYDENGNLNLIVEAVGKETERKLSLTHDLYGQVKGVTSIADGETEASTVQYFYDDYGNIKKIIDGILNEQLFTHDSRGNITSHTDGRGKIWGFDYDSIGNLTLKRTPNQFETKFIYNKSGQLIETEHPDNSKINYNYDSLGRVVKTTDEMGGVFRTEFSTAGKLQKIISEVGDETEYSYDLLGRLTSISGSDGMNIALTYIDMIGGQLDLGAFYQPSKIEYPTYSVELKYDLQNRVVQEKYIYNHLGQIKSEIKNVKYDAIGNVIETSGNAERTILLKYDALNRRTQRYHQGTLVNQYFYDSRDNLITFTDANLQQHSYEYDKVNNLVKIIRPMGEFHSFIFDENSYIKFKQDALGNRIEYVYDDDSRQIGTKIYSSNQQLKKNISYTLNNRGAIENYDDGTLIGTASYDLKLNKLSESVQIHDQLMSHSYEYYKNDQTKSFTGADNIKYNFYYDNSRLTNIVIPDQGNISFSNFHGNKPEIVSLPGGIKKQYVYDGLQRMLSIEVKNASEELLMNHLYQYNVYGHTSKKQTMQGLHEFGYDDLDQLNTASHPTLPSEQYQYDNVGNRKLSLDTGNTEWQYNQNNQLINSVTNQFQYDDNGNMIKRMDSNETTLDMYKYDESMRLTHILNADGQDIYEYYYDPFGRRIYKKDLSTDEIIYYHYGKEGMIHKRSANGSKTNYLHLPFSLAESKPILKHSGGEYFYYLNDDLGTPHKIINSDGEVVLAREFSAFGNVRNYTEMDSHSDLLMFPGQYFDQETFTYHNYHRDFAPGLGRYIQRDPLGTIPDANEYVYVSNAPLNYIDPKGLAKLGGGICFGFGARACAEIELDISFTCITAKLCFKFTLGADTRPSANNEETKGSGSASIGPWKGSRRGGGKKHRWDGRGQFIPPPPNPSCFSFEAGCKINVPYFHVGAGYSSSGGLYAGGGVTLEDRLIADIGCTARGCIQVYSTCNKCQGFNGCGD